MNLLTILLQVADIANTFSWQRLFDVGLSLGILGVIAKVLWARQKSMEDRMQKYLEEDRREMMEVIQNNTKAFEKLYEHLEKH